MVVSMGQRQRAMLDEPTKGIAEMRDRWSDMSDILFALGFTYANTTVDYVAQNCANLYYRIKGKFITDYYKRRIQDN